MPYLEACLIALFLTLSLCAPVAPLWGAIQVDNFPCAPIGRSVSPCGQRRGNTRNATAGTAQTAIGSAMPIVATQSRWQTAGRSQRATAGEPEREQRTRTQTVVRQLRYASVFAFLGLEPRPKSLSKLWD
jgi:hypothetical protein